MSRLPQSKARDGRQTTPQKMKRPSPLQIDLYAAVVVLIWVAMLASLL